MPSIFFEIATWISLISILSLLDNLAHDFASSKMSDMHSNQPNYKLVMKKK